MSRSRLLIWLGVGDVGFRQTRGIVWLGGFGPDPPFDDCFDAGMTGLAILDGEMVAGTGRAGVVFGTSFNGEVITLGVGRPEVPDVPFPGAVLARFGVRGLKLSFASMLSNRGTGRLLIAEGDPGGLGMECGVFGIFDGGLVSRGMEDGVAGGAGAGRRGTIRVSRVSVGVCWIVFEG